ncbi:MAG: hypothetical protein HQK66_05155 [Desulfamplus sp.]|nr:hypothetical protein [Desulfamplus sp.]
MNDENEKLIFFCEECGEKNLVDSDIIKEGRVTFKCAHCNYLNNYPVPGFKNKAN